MSRRRVAIAAASGVALCLLLGACTQGPMSVLDPAGPAAASVTRIWWTMFWGAMLALALVTALAAYAALRNPERRIQIGAGKFVAVGGVAWPLLTVLALLIFGLPSGRALLPTATEREVFRIEVTAHQWWWEIAYPDAPEGTVYSANHLLMPVGKPVDVHVRTQDVIHSFWIPRLGGKIDAIPGRTNVIRLEALAAGRHRGQCAEFCGLQHARMAFIVDALPAASLQSQLRAPAVTTGPAAAPAVFARECSECHSLDPRMRNPLGPNLAHFAARPTIGAGALPNTPQALRTWLTQHQQVKPGNRMPASELSVSDVDALVSLLGARP